jgi:UDP-N-acetyl-D-mannosaminuronic acid dehydrogenase
MTDGSQEAARGPGLSGVTNFSQVVLVGCGAIGLPLAVAFASRGCDVVGVDTDAVRLAALQAGRMSDLDEGLGEAFASAVRAGRLSFQAALAPSHAPRAFILAVPTPVDSAGTPILANVEAAIEAIGASGRDQDLLVVRATVPIGTARKLAGVLAARGRSLLVAACPDRSVAGRSFREQFSVPHIIGGMDRDAAEAAASLFGQLGPTVQVSTPETAEAIKLFANVQRDVTFALANQFALVSEQLDLDFGEIVRAGSEGYARFSLARPGPVAGPCLTKDTAILAASLAEPGTLALARAARRLNESLLEHVASAVRQHLDRAKRPRPVVAVLGLAFKGNPPTTDRRGSFGLALAVRLRADVADATLRLGEPTSDDPAERDLETVIAGADVVVIANDHPAITALGAHGMAQRMTAGAMIYDTPVALPFMGGLPNGVILYRIGYGPLWGDRDQKRPSDAIRSKHAR